MKVRAIAIATTVTVLISVVLVGRIAWVKALNTGMEALENDDTAGAQKNLIPLARLGSPSAQRLLGEAYATGLPGFPKDQLQAVYWFRRCGPSCGLKPPNVIEKTRDPAASMERMIGESYLAGAGGARRDPVEAEKWLRLAANGGSAEAVVLIKSQGWVYNRSNPASSRPQQ